MIKQLRQRDEGFTLIELLMAITISGIIMSALATGFVSMVRGTKDLHERFLESQDAQQLATYFPADVQSANPMMIVDTSTSPAGECGGITGTHVVRMRWLQIDGATMTAFSASYRLASTASGSELTRWFCSGPGSALGAGTDAEKAAAILAPLTATPKVVARNLAAALPAVSVGATSVDMTLASFKTGYSYKFSGTMRTPGSWLALAVTGPASATAGTDITFNLTAKNSSGGNDVSVDGSKTVTVAGFSASPNGTTPLSSATGNFSAGVGSVTLKLYKAGATSLTFTLGSHRTSTPVAITINAGAFSPGNLSFSVCPPDTKVNKPNTLQVLRTMSDLYGNATTTAPTATVNVAITNAAPASATATFAPNSGTSGSVTVTNPSTPGTTVTLNATSGGYAPDTCTYKTNNPAFLVSTLASPVAGSEFMIKVTATTDGTTTDLAYTGLKTLSFSGVANAPNGTAPTSTVTVDFITGVANNVPITLYKAETATLTVSDPTTSGTLPVTVAAGPMALTFSACPATLKKNTSLLNETVLRQDVWGNPSATATAVTVSVPTPAGTNGNFTPPGGGSNVSSFTTTVPAGSSASPSFSYNAPNSKDVSITLSAGASGFTTATCTITTN
jgi:prepilin-type N-terminal cleavage/methylation domain-containing protein